MSGLSEADYRVILGSLYPGLEADLVNRLVDFNTVLNREVVSQRLWGQAGAPWEFNLRDLLRYHQFKNERSDFSPYILYCIGIMSASAPKNCYVSIQFFNHLRKMRKYVLDREFLLNMLVFYNYVSVFRIRDILVQILIHGSAD
jgi:hypothetical protein